MPRNASGTYTLPSGNPVVSGTLIDATWANNTLSDLGNEVTDSLSRSGEGAMLAPLRITDGVQATPSLAFSNEPSSGLYRGGSNEWWAVAAGVQNLRFTNTGLTTRAAAGAVGTPSLAAFNDTDTGIYFPGANELAIATGGVGALWVNSSQNVGIGTASPGSYGKLALVSSGSPTTAYHSVLSGVGTYNNAFESTVYLGLARTDVVNNNAIAGYRIKNYGANATGSYLAIEAASSAVGANAPPTTFTERMRLDSSGMLGLGVVPNALWDANTFRAIQITSAEYFSIAAQYTSSAYGSLLWNAIGSGNETFVYAKTGDKASRFAQQYGFVWYTAPSGTAGSAITFTPAMTLDGYTGNLGIGTASPAQKLDVKGIVSFQATNSTNYWAVYTNTDNTFRINYNAASDDEVVIDPSGNVGIGTASPAVKLQVAGAIRSNSSVTGPLANLFTSATNPASSGASGNGLNLGYDSNGEVAWIQANRNSISETRPLLLNPNGGSVAAGASSLATTATDGFLYVPTCAGTPTGTPAAITGMAPIVVNTTNNKLYFYSGGAWRDAGP